MNGKKDSDLSLFSAEGHVWVRNGKVWMGNIRFDERMEEKTRKNVFDNNKCP